MDNKDFIDKLSACSGHTDEETIRIVTSLVDCMTLAWQEGKAVLLQGFGMFEVRKEMEYVSVNPLTHQRFLNPPCLRLCFIPIQALEGTRLPDGCLTELDLADRLTKESGLANSIVFVGSFFMLIKKAMTDEKYVKVKGIGTFKIIGTGAGEYDEDLLYRNSVCCGVSFVPDASLRDVINKPFSHFGAVSLKENVEFADLQEVPVAVTMESKDEIREGNLEKEEPVAAENCRAAIIDPQFSAKSAVSDKGRDDYREKGIFPVVRMPWCMLACVLLVGVIVGAGGIWGLVSEYKNTPKTILQYKEMRSEPIGISDTLEPATFSPSSMEKTLPVQPVPVMEKKVETSVTDKKVLADTIRYAMSGTLKQHTLQGGESLTKLALKYYGNKKLWPYLVRYNQKTIKNPDNIPVGTIIQIPVLAPKAKEE